MVLAIISLDIEREDRSIFRYESCVNDQTSEKENKNKNKVVSRLKWKKKRKRADHHLGTHHYHRRADHPKP